MIKGKYINLKPGISGSPVWTMLLVLTLICCTFVSKVQGYAKTKRVLSFYYPWYGITTGPGGHGKTVHWGKIAAQSRDIEASTHYPLLGAYDSYDPAVIAQHNQWAIQMGLDGWIVSWWGHGSYTDRAIPRLLEACQNQGLKACLYYEKTPDARTPEATAQDICQLLQAYGSHPAYLQVQGKPVLFVYGRALQQLGLWGWYQTLQQVRAHYRPGIVLIGDQMDAAAATVFDGIHTYNTAGSLAGKTLPDIASWAAQTYPAWVHLARQYHKISTLTVIPGYNDTKIRSPGLQVKRFQGFSYATQWEHVLTAAPDWVLITSFNEWHEGSEIEPSVEYGHEFLALTRAYVYAFKNGHFATSTPAPTALSEKERTAVDHRLQSLHIAVLPNPESLAFWWLLDKKAHITVLTWEDIAAGKLTRESFDAVLYAGNEHYCPTVHQPNDVDTALSTYLQAGGSLWVFPSAPMPFFYDLKNHPLNRAATFGLSLRVAWEQPPQAELRFVQPTHRLSDLPPIINFPATGDRRWRPCDPPPGARDYQSLLSLQDTKGKSYGDGLARWHSDQGGQLVYGWFGLLKMPMAADLLYDLMAQAILSTSTSRS